MGQLTWSNFEPPNSIDDPEFTMPLGVPPSPWAPEAGWIMNNQKAVFKQAGAAAGKLLVQAFVPYGAGKRFTIVIVLNSISAGIAVDHGLNFNSAGYFNFELLEPGTFSVSFIAPGGGARLNIGAPDNPQRNAECEIESVFAYEEVLPDFWANRYGYGFQENLYYQNYDRGGGRYTPFYCQRTGKTRIWIAIET